MSNIKMSGRVYNAMMKFANGTSACSQLANMFYSDGRVYATDSYAVVRWTPAVKPDCAEPFFFSATKKPTASQWLYVSAETCDIDIESVVPKNMDKLFDEPNFAAMRGENRVPAINPTYLADIAALGKAVKGDKCGGDGSTILEWKNDTLVAHIYAGANGRFDVVVAPCFVNKID